MYCGTLDCDGHGASPLRSVGARFNPAGINLPLARSWAYRLRSCLGWIKPVLGRPETKPPLASRGGNRFDCNDFFHVQQLSSQFWADRSVRIIPPLSLETASPNAPVLSDP